MITGDITQAGAYIAAGLATVGMGGAAIGVGMIVGSVLKHMPKKNDTGTMFRNCIRRSIRNLCISNRITINVCSIN